MSDHIKARMIGGKIQFEPIIIFSINADDFDI